ncbi:MAG: rRNA ((1939)-C(5))-methyltransferase RlmD [Haloplasmataceae bacterium]|jgi:23S rRNA (uracil-5-)-methyltransferase RumA|nr:rRNA ((1939)-C(5))-methyltransferase RlmD [Haloplasmataceae bacterium]
MKENFQTLLTIKRLGINGEGIGYYKRKAVFVEGALPEEEVICQIEKEENTYLVAKTVKIKTRSEHRVDAPCPYFGRCGGCQLQHLDYQQQLKQKRDIIVQAMERYLHNYEELNIELKDMIGMEDPYNYRNKAQMPVAFDGEKVVTGLYEANTNRLIHIDKCIIQDNTINSIIYYIKTLLMKYHVMVFNRKIKDGNLRYISVRYIKDTNEAQVVLVINNKELQNMSKIANELIAKHKEVVSFYVNVNPDIHTHEILGAEYIHIAGKKTMDALIGKSKFILSPHSFFQLNSEQCKVMYDIIKETAQLKPSYNVIDAYCGAGTIGIYIADSVGSVRGVDITEQAINDAKNNAAINELKNTHFESGHAEEVIPKWIDEGFKADVIILDPPRTGIEASLLNVLRRVKIKKLVYVSCNASTLAKDLNELRKVYHIKTIQPIDMFPQTSHVEAIVYLVRK